MFDILSIGEILIDLTQDTTENAGVPSYLAMPGGAPANLAVAASKLGSDTAFVGKTGNDAFGKLLKETLEKYNVNTEGLGVNQEIATTLAVVSVDTTGERSFSFYRNPGADLTLNMDDIEKVLPLNRQGKPAQVLHFGSVSLTAEPSKSAVLEAVRRGKEKGCTITYDPNYRERLWNSEREAVSAMTEPLNMVDILKISDEELPLITGTNDVKSGTTALINKGITLVLVTLGPEGVFYNFKGLTGTVSGFKVKIGDTNGAGDTFFGAFLNGITAEARKNSQEAGEYLRQISVSNLEIILKNANKAAAITTSRKGAIPAMPTKNEMDTMEL